MALPPPQKTQTMTLLFWAGMVALLSANLDSLRAVPPSTAIGALAIGVACMFPVYLWCDGQVQGLPVFPFFSLTYLWTFCLPLLSENPNVWAYSPEAHLKAALSTVLFLVSGTVIWLQIVRTPETVKKPFRALKTDTADNVFIAMVAAGAFLNMYVVGGWSGIPDKLFTIVRGIILGLSFLGIFVLAYRAGQNSMPRTKQYIFFAALVANIATAAAGLILKTALTLFLLSVMAYVIGGKRLPVIGLLMGFFLLLPLHYGKHEMRHKYWESETAHYVQPWQYPAWFSEWHGYAEENKNHVPERWEKVEEKESFVERSSVIHMLMMAQEKIPEPYPYLGGKTYAIIPGLLVPRILNPQKPRSHEGTHMLNVHVRRQTYQQTWKTTIAWGLLPEAYANFGYFGCLLIGGIMGAFYGTITLAAIGTPPFSARMMFCVLVMSLALASTEWTAGVYAATLFQSSVPIVGIKYAFMKVYRPNSRGRKPNNLLAYKSPVKNYYPYLIQPKSKDNQAAKSFR
ncbi:hypothetical protein [Phormidium sp. FACHB-1136]|uniref:hypothetical protein n=1 Tax=Phormidium sp. FACHB-1136 TaxID=2692848 RepID=UPI00168458C4|nr:hypothetical protein [Phormidium sp. FACHB-1136]MBD2426750.1 hypothetical protein [Phormidium sp. FACHB-1136]